jgi:hypothetical protein
MTREEENALEEGDATYFNRNNYKQSDPGAV